MKKDAGKLFIVATPIGNLKDITLRALETLKEVDVIACEDTRRTRILLEHYGIKKQLISYHKHKERQGSQQIAKLLEKGENVALVSDAGMPCISDPGALLVKYLRQQDFDVTVLPGASALTCAVALSGIEGSFTFLGFLSTQKKDRENLINKFKFIPSALVIYCSPYDLVDNLQFLYEQLGKRNVHIIKEISKIYENIYTGILGEVEIPSPKGEYVIVVEADLQDVIEVSDKEIKELLQVYYDIGWSKRDAIQQVCQELNINKNKVYALSLKD